MATVTVTVQCIVCQELHNIHVHPESYAKWRYEGEYIQNAMPYLSADDRELLISGICGNCFDGMYGPEDEDENMEFLNRINKNE